MATIRALEREDIPTVTRLVRENLPGWRHDEAFLEHALIGHPWTPEVPPSLVALDDEGQIVGSIGAQARHLVFDGARLNGISVSHLVVDPQRRGGAAGALLVKRLLAGEQDLTWTDSGTEDVVRIWRTFGARIDHVRACNWMLVLRPGSWLRQVASLRLRRDRTLRQTVSVAALPLHAAGTRLLPRSSPVSAPSGVVGEDASSSQIVEELPAATKGIRLRVDYDVSYLSSVSENAGSASAPVVQRLVRRAETPVGWYAYIRQPGVSRLIHLAARPREVESVFGEFEAHARSHGATALAGRVEPHLHEPLHRRYAAIGLGQRPLVHAHDPELRALLGSSAALITEMDLIDSEWW